VWAVLYIIQGSEWARIEPPYICIHTPNHPSTQQNLVATQTTAGAKAAQRHRQRIAAPAAAVTPPTDAVTNKLPVNVRRTLSNRISYTHVKKHATTTATTANKATKRHVEQSHHLFTWHETCINSMHGPNNKQTPAA
jgi:hypothetical protein